MVDVVVLCDVVLCAFSDKCCCGPPLGCSFQEHSLQKVTSGADYNAIACQEPLSETLAPVYKKKQVQEKSKHFNSENAVKKTKSPHFFNSFFFSSSGKKNRVKEMWGLPHTWARKKTHPVYGPQGQGLAS